LQAAEQHNNTLTTQPLSRPSHAD